MIALAMLALAVLVAPTRRPAVHRLRALSRRGSSEPLAPRPGATRLRTLPVGAGLGSGMLLFTVLGCGLRGTVLGLALGVGAALGAHRVLRGEAGRQPDPDPLALAGGWDLLAACLRSGLPVPVAVRAAAGHLPGSAAAELLRVGELLALGADAATAWQVAASSPVHKLARAARRSACSGAGLESTARSLAAEIRADAVNAASTRAQRAGVLITGPLGLCFLPAFLALGVLPVVIGLATGLLRQW